MTGKTTTKKHDTTRQRIIDSFLDLMKHREIDQITVKSVSSQMNISRSTFYTYFSDTESLIHAIETELLKDMPRKTVFADTFENRLNSPENTEDIHEISWETEWLTYYYRNRKALNALLGPNGDPRFQIKYRNHLKKEIGYHMDIDGFPKDSYRDYFQVTYTDFLLGLAYEWSSKDETDLSVEQLARIASTIRIGSKLRIRFNHQKKM